MDNRILAFAVALGALPVSCTHSAGRTTAPGPTAPSLAVTPRAGARPVADTGLAPCTSRQQVLKRVDREYGSTCDPEHWREFWEGSPPEQRPKKVEEWGVLPLELGPGNTLDLVFCPSDCGGTGNCSYEVYGTYKGCYRRIGDFNAAWFRVVPTPGAKWPPVQVCSNMGGLRSHCKLLHFRNGRWEEGRSFICDFDKQPLPDECRNK